LVHATQYGIRARGFEFALAAAMAAAQDAPAAFPLLSSAAGAEESGAGAPPTTTARPSSGLSTPPQPPLLLQPRAQAAQALRPTVMQSSRSSQPASHRSRAQPGGAVEATAAAASFGMAAPRATLPVAAPTAAAGLPALHPEATGPGAITAAAEGALAPALAEAQTERARPPARERTGPCRAFSPSGPCCVAHRRHHGTPRAWKPPMLRRRNCYPTSFVADRRLLRRRGYHRQRDSRRRHVRGFGGP
jgi:hypothetical protein